MEAHFSALKMAGLFEFTSDQYAAAGNPWRWLTEIADPRATLIIKEKP